MSAESEFLLDTNVVSGIIKDDPSIKRAYLLFLPSQFAISVITEGELRYGLAKKPEASGLHKLVAAFLNRVQVIPWTREVAAGYGSLRAVTERSGVTIGKLDLLIAAQALVAGRTLITNDKTLLQLRPWLKVQDWKHIPKRPN